MLEEVVKDPVKEAGVGEIVERHALQTVKVIDNRSQTPQAVLDHCRALGRALLEWRVDHYILAVNHHRDFRVVRRKEKEEGELDRHTELL